VRVGSVGIVSAAPTRYDLTREQLGVHLDGEPRYRLDQVWSGLYEQLVDPAEITNLPKQLRERLDAELPTALELVTESVSDAGDTIKFLWELEGGSRVETVLMLYPDRATVCVSSQAGCAMACGFCATGQAGFTRHLTVGEIVEQVVRASRRARAADRRVSNIVFMGMGEPMANLDKVWGATERIHGDIGLSARHITISTVGIIPGIRALKDLPLPVNLAISLHAANDALRDELVPINKRYPINDLLDACADYLEVKNRRVSFEWAMIDGVNDRRSDAEELAELCWKIRPSAHVNLIPLNPTPGFPTKGTSVKRVHAFRDHLEELGANATVRRNRGTDIDAACGQLAAGQAVVVTRTTSRQSTR
jgi:23S rRNA (adenine2503-C2)-methyltransferase